MKLQHVIESQQFTVPLLMELFDRTRRMEKIVARGGTQDYEHKVMATLFYKSSTRTRFSFESAMYRLGGRVLSTENGKEFSSEIKGESLEDTIRIIANYSDVIVLRHTDEGAAKRAATVSPVPIINAVKETAASIPLRRFWISIRSIMNVKRSTACRWR